MNPLPVEQTDVRWQLTGILGRCSETFGQLISVRHNDNPLTLHPSAADRKAADSKLFPGVSCPSTDSKQVLTLWQVCRQKSCCLKPNELWGIKNKVSKYQKVAEKPKKSMTWFEYLRFTWYFSIRIPCYFIFTLDVTHLWCKKSRMWCTFIGKKNPKPL